MRKVRIMSFSSAFKKSLRVSCYGFCAMTLLYSLIMLALYDTYASMSVITVMLFCPFCFIIAFANELMRGSRIHGFVRAIIRYLAIMAAFGLCICLPNRASLSGASATILFVAVTVIYIIGAMITLKYNTNIKKKDEQKAEYKNVYSEGNRK